MLVTERISHELISSLKAAFLERECGRSQFSPRASKRYCVLVTRLVFHFEMCPYVMFADCASAIHASTAVLSSLFVLGVKPVTLGRWRN